jgi:hypothetical protein
MDRPAGDRRARRIRDPELKPSLQGRDPFSSPAQVVGPIERGPRWVVSVVGLVAALALLEAAARIAGPNVCLGTRGLFLDASSTVGWTFTPGLTVTLRSCGAETMPGQVPVTINQRGLADLERPYAKGAGEVRVILLGNQLADGLTAERDDRLANRLSNMADRRRGARLAVINAAIEGYATGDELRWLREEGIRYSPDVVVLIVDADRDLRASLSPVAARPVPPAFPPPSGLMRWSGFARWFAGRPSALPSSPVEIGEPPATGSTEAWRTALAASVDLVAETAAVSRSAGSGFAVLVGKGCGGTATTPGAAGGDGPSGTEVCAALGDSVPCRALDAAFAGVLEPGRQCVDGGRRWSRDALFLASHVVWDLLASSKLWPESVVKGWRL